MHMNTRAYTFSSNRAVLLTGLAMSLGVVACGGAEDEAEGEAAFGPIEQQTVAIENRGGARGVAG